VTPEYTGFWRELLDWQTIIAGLLALAAGLLAFYCGATASSRDQETNAALSARGEEAPSARGGLLPGRLLDGVLIDARRRHP